MNLLEPCDSGKRRRHVDTWLGTKWT